MTLLSSVKAAFPIFTHHPRLVYLDNASTSQKPNMVLDRLNDFYAKENANIHRGLYDLSTQATGNYEEVRSKVAHLLGAENPLSITFTKGTTDSINMVAQSFLKKKLKEGDNVVITALEHHSNMIPWQQLCHSCGASLEVIPVSASGELILTALDQLLTDKTRLLAVAQISNTLGTINPIREMVMKAHKKDIPVLVDGAQSAGHYPLNVVGLDVDFLAFSSHKMFGPMGVGVLYCKDILASDFTPSNFGGGMVKDVSFDSTQFFNYPHAMEAGTVDVGGVIGFGAALDFVSRLDLTEISIYERKLADLFREGIENINHVRAVGEPEDHSGIVSFVVDHIHPHDVSTFLAEKNIAVRAGHHCTQPLLDVMGVKATVRASFSIYNTLSDVDAILEELKTLIRFWR